jgi:hypothetical protein
LLVFEEIDTAENQVINFYSLISLREYSKDEFLLFFRLLLLSINLLEFVFHNKELEPILLPQEIHPQDAKLNIITHRSQFGNYRGFRFLIIFLKQGLFDHQILLLLPYLAQSIYPFSLVKLLSFEDFLYEHYLSIVLVELNFHIVDVLSRRQELFKNLHALLSLLIHVR